MVLENCLCGKKGVYKVEHGFLCKICYLRQIENKLFRFVTKNQLISPNKKYLFICDSSADKVKLNLLEKLFTKFGLENFKTQSSKFTCDYKKDLEQLAKKSKGHTIILP
ncbi:MAG: hypothetical protein PHH82_03065, partial [Candidatus ainarchaeum sp.]|nr:hypothetical protein [Candidatus ainarchaeum sp.]